MSVALNCFLAFIDYHHDSCFNDVYHTERYPTSSATPYVCKLMRIILVELIIYLYDKLVFSSIQILKHSMFEYELSKFINSAVNSLGNSHYIMRIRCCCKPML